jgi:hypothetical protein
MLFRIITIATFIIALTYALSTVSAAAISKRSEAEVPFSKCSASANYPITVHSIRVNPSPPQFGAPVSVTAVGDLATTINQGAKAVITAKIGLIPITSEFDLCAETAKDGLPCPIAPGNNTQIKISTELPDLIFSNVNVDLRVNLVNADNSVLTCLKTVLRVV